MEIIFYIDEPITSKVATLEMIPRDTELILLDFIVKKYKMALYSKYEKMFSCSSVRNIRTYPWQNYFDWWFELFCWKITEHVWSRMSDKKTNLFPVFEPRCIVV